GKHLMENSAFPSVLSDQVVHPDITVLPIAMDPPHPLLQAVRVPGDVPVDEVPTELEIDTFPGSICGDHHLRSKSEFSLGILAGIHIHAPMDRCNGVALLG